MKSDNHIVIFTPGFAAHETDVNCIPPLQAFVISLKEQYPQTDIKVVSFQYPFKEEIYQWNDLPIYAAGGANKKSFYRIITWFKSVQVFFLHKQKGKSYGDSLLLAYGMYFNGSGHWKIIQYSGCSNGSRPGCPN